MSPTTMLDLLGTVGGTIGLFLGGSLFSVIEIFYNLGLCGVSITRGIITIFR